MNTEGTKIGRKLAFFDFVPRKLNIFSGPGTKFQTPTRITLTIVNLYSFNGFCHEEFSKTKQMPYLLKKRKGQIEKAKVLYFLHL